MGGAGLARPSFLGNLLPFFPRLPSPFLCLWTETSFGTVWHVGPFLPGICMSCWALTPPNTPFLSRGGPPPQDWKRVAFFELIISSVLAEPLPCLGRAQVGYWGCLVLSWVGDLLCAPQIPGRDSMMGKGDTGRVWFQRTG